MKNVKTYEKKTRKLLGAFAKKAPQAIEDMNEAIGVLVEIMLLENSTPAKAAKAFKAICEEYVDFNDLRVSPAKEIHDCIGSDYPQCSVKAHMIADVLRGIFYKTSNMSLEYIGEMNKRDRVRHMQELGLSSFAISMVLLTIFETRAVPVDQDLADSLEMDGAVQPGLTLEQIASFVANLATSKNCFGAHLACRKYVEKSAKALAKWRKAKQAEIDRLEAIEREKAEKAAQAKAEKAAKAKAKAKEKANAAKKKARQAAKAAKVKAAKAAKKAAKKVAKKPVKKAAKKTAKKAAKKPAKKAAKKVANKQAKKDDKKHAKNHVKTDDKKTAQKPANKVAKKPAKKAARKTASKKARGKKK